MCGKWRETRLDTHQLEKDCLALLRREKTITVDGETCMYCGYYLWQPALSHDEGVNDVLKGIDWDYVQSMETGEYYGMG